MEWSLFGHIPRRNLNQEILERSLYDKPAFKQVIAPMAKEMFSPITFDNTIEQKECPIDMDEFQQGEELLRLPCSHLFRKSAILNWLENQNAQCPICRYQFPYVEVRNEQANDTSDENYESRSNDLEDDIAIGRSNLLSSLLQIYGRNH